MFLLIGLIFMLVFMGSISSVKAIDCGGSLTYSCGGYPNNTVRADWKITPQNGLGDNTCNVFITGAQGDHTISNLCTGGWGPVKKVDGEDLSVTDDAAYKLVVSNGDSAAGCYNKVAYDTPAKCTSDNYQACSSDKCTNCLIINQGSDQGKGFLKYYKDNGQNGLNDISCGNQTNIIKNWCTSVNPSGCTSLKNAACKSDCGGGAGACTVDWSLSSDNPAANSSMTVKVGGKSDPGGWQKIGLALDNQDQKLTRIDGGPTFVFENVNTGAAGSHMLSFSVNDKSTTCTPQKTYIAGTAVAPTPTTKTTQYRISQTKFDETDTKIAWQTYSSEPTTVPVVFTNLVPGQDLTVFVQFKADDKSTSKVLSKSIKYSPPAKISQTSCSFNPSGQGTLVTISGENFGDQGQGQVLVNGQVADIVSWTGQLPTVLQKSATVPDSKNTGAQTFFSQIVAKIADKPDTSTKLSVELKTDNGSDLTSSCIINTASLDFDAKIGCRASGDFTVNDVDISITEETTGAKPLVQQKIQLDQSGHPTGFTPVLETGKKYLMLVKAPKSVAKKVEFTASDGSTVLPNIDLPIGDIAPQGNPDGSINSLDRSELVREWSLTSGVQRPGDFNMDSAVNSLDWSCMRASFNQSDEK